MPGLTPEMTGGLLPGDKCPHDILGDQSSSSVSCKMKHSPGLTQLSDVPSAPSAHSPKGPGLWPPPHSWGDRTPLTGFSPKSQGFHKSPAFREAQIYSAPWPAAVEHRWQWSVPTAHSLYVSCWSRSSEVSPPFRWRPGLCSLSLHIRTAGHSKAEGTTLKLQQAEPGANPGVAKHCRFKGPWRQKLKGDMDGSLEQWGLGTQGPGPQVIPPLSKSLFCSREEMRAGIRAN